ncbi:MAG: glycosyltransferase [Gemmatimonadota bacterium]
MRLSQEISRDSGDQRPRFSVVVPVLNALPHLEACADALARAAECHGGVEILFVDNGSSDGSHEFLRRRTGEGSRLLQHAGNTVSAVRNYGACRARGAYLSFIDADCVVCPDYFQAADRIIREIRPAVTGSGYSLPETAGWIERTWNSLHARSEDGWVNYLPAGNLVVGADLFHSTGGFDEGLATGEDAEFCQRVRREGHGIYECRRLRVQHLGNPRTLRAFFRQQAWHGLGALGTARDSLIDKPLATTVLHGLFLLAGLVCLMYLHGVRLGLRVMLLVAVGSAVPGAAVLYRLAARKKWSEPLRPFLLYHLYFAARLLALANLLLGRKGRRR